MRISSHRGMINQRHLGDGRSHNVVIARRVVGETPECMFPKSTAHFRTLTQDERELCEHPGPCKPGRGCRCYDTESYCDRNCGCPLDCEFSRSFSDFQVAERDFRKVATEGSVADVTSLTTKRGISVLTSAHVWTAARNATLSFVFHAMLGQEFFIDALRLTEVAELSRVGVRLP
jgi:hypothetical protein